jgi:hypothetical protein
MSAAKMARNCAVVSAASWSPFSARRSSVSSQPTCVGLSAAMAASPSRRSESVLSAWICAWLSARIWA